MNECQYCGHTISRLGEYVQQVQRSIGLAGHRQRKYTGIRRGSEEQPELSTQQSQNSVLSFPKGSSLGGHAYGWHSSGRQYPERP